MEYYDHRPQRKRGRTLLVAAVLGLGIGITSPAWQPGPGAAVAEAVTLQGTTWTVRVKNAQGEYAHDNYRFFRDGTFSASGFADCSPVPFRETILDGKLRFSTYGLCRREHGDQARVWFKGTLNLLTGALRGKIVPATGEESTFIAQNSSLDQQARRALKMTYGKKGAQRMAQYLTKITDLLSDTVADNLAVSGESIAALSTCVPTVTYPGGQPTDTDHDLLPDEATLDFGTAGCDVNNDGVTDIRYAVRVLDTGAGMRLEFAVNGQHLQVTVSSSGTPQTFTLGGALGLETITTIDETNHLTVSQTQTYDQFSLQNNTSAAAVVSGTLTVTEETSESQSHHTTAMGDLTITVGTEPALSTTFTLATDTQDSNSNGQVDLYEMSVDSTVTQDGSTVDVSTNTTPLTGDSEACDWPLDGRLTLERGRDTVVVDFGNPADCALAAVTVNGIPVGTYNFTAGTWE